MQTFGNYLLQIYSTKFLAKILRNNWLMYPKKYTFQDETSLFFHILVYDWTIWSPVWYYQTTGIVHHVLFLPPSQKDYKSLLLQMFVTDVLYWFQWDCLN